MINIDTRKSTAFLDCSANAKLACFPVASNINITSTMAGITPLISNDSCWVSRSAEYIFISNLTTSFAQCLVEFVNEIFPLSLAIF